MEDFNIIELYFNRDEKAIKETEKKYHNYCFSIAYNILFNNEDTLETLNDTYLATWNSIPPHQPSNLATYLGKITRRLSLNKLRLRKADKRGNGEAILSFDELEGCIKDNSFKENIEAQYLSDIINDFLRDLDQTSRKIFVCRYYYFDSIEDISKRFNFSISKVKMNLKRNRDKLKDHLLKEGIIV